MNTLDAILARRSCRNFIPNSTIPPPNRSVLAQAFNAAPSAGGIRPLTAYYPENQTVIADLAAAAHQPWIANASLVVVILADFPKIARKYHARGHQYALLEAGHAAQNVCLVATDLGLGSCCVGSFRESRVLDAIGLNLNTQPDCGLTPIYMVAVGYIAHKE